MHVPQIFRQDVLAHKNVKLFITHGGLGSFLESMYHAKPVLVMPGFVDQFFMANRATSLGMGLRLDWKELTAEKLS